MMTGTNRNNFSWPRIQEDTNQVSCPEYFLCTLNSELLNKPMAEAQADTGNQHCPKDLLHESLSFRHLRNFGASLVEFEVVSALWSRSLACQHLFGCSVHFPAGNILTTSTLSAPLHPTFSFLYFWSHLLQFLVESPKISNWYLVFTHNTIH